jgi:hypothetical protein
LPHEKSDLPLPVLAISLDKTETTGNYNASVFWRDANDFGLHASFSSDIWL